MTHKVDAERRDAVLSQFHRECTRPTAEQIINWTKRYPEFANDIRAHAAIILDWAAEEGDEEEVVEQELLDRARSKALNAIFNAQSALRSQTQTETYKTFDELLGAVNLTTASLSRDIDIPREVLSDLFRGHMLPPIGKRLFRMLMLKLHATALELEGALTRTLANPSLGHAHAVKQPSIVKRSYEEIIRASDIPAEKKSYWLEQE